MSDDPITVGISYKVYREATEEERSADPVTPAVDFYEERRRMTLNQDQEVTVFDDKGAILWSEGDYVSLLKRIEALSRAMVRKASRRADALFRDEKT